MADVSDFIDVSDPAALEDAVARAREAKAELFNLRFQKATGQLTNTARIAQVKREVARCLTEARSREIAAAERLAAHQQQPPCLWRLLPLLDPETD